MTPDTTEQRLSDFLFVYYPDELAKTMRKDINFATATIMEDIEGGISPLGRLQAYAKALRDCMELLEQGVQTIKKVDKKPFKSPLNHIGDSNG